MRYRHEYKYQINAIQEAILNVQLMGLMKADSHAGIDGKYIVRSLYFDDIYDSCLWDNLAGSDPRSKIRIRYYNHDTDYITLERKTKKRGMTLKESCRLSLQECKLLTEGENVEILDDMDDMKKTLLLDIQQRGLMPKIIVTYERIPYIYPAGNVRVTFDRCLSSSNEVQKFLTGNYQSRPVFPTGMSILEVKWDEVMPRHIRDAIHVEKLVWTAFSKYYMCRTIHL